MSRGRPPIDARLRLERQLTPEPNTGCWLFTGATRDASKSYGAFQWKGRKLYAHRAAWELEYGPAPRHLDVDHLCNQPLCCNPKHLQLTTPRLNRQLQFERQTHCPRGHLKAPETTERRGMRGDRERKTCLACRQISRHLAKGRTETEAIADARREWPELFAAAEKRIAGIVIKKRRAANSEAA